jgi:hypothetical protein
MEPWQSGGPQFPGPYGGPPPPQGPPPAPQQWQAPPQPHPQWQPQAPPQQWQAPPQHQPQPQWQAPAQPQPGYAPQHQGMPPGPGNGPVVIDVGATASRQAVIGAVVSGVIGLIAIVAGLGGDDGGGAVAVVIGVVFLLPTLLVVGMSKQLFRPRKLVFEPQGVRWDDPQGKPWAVAWHDLAVVAISKHSAMKTPQTLNDKLVEAATDKMLGERAHVRLDLYPVHPGFAQHQPNMAHLWERQGVKHGYRLPLGSNVKYIPIIDQAMRMFAPQVYRGVQATEGIMGLS